MKNLAPIDNVIAMHEPCSVLLMDNVVVLSVEYASGRVKHYFPRRLGLDYIPARVFTFIQTALQYYPTSEMTVFRYGNQT